MNHLSLPLSPTMDENEKNSNNINHHSMIHEFDPAISISHNHEQKSSSPYVMLSVGDNQHLGSSDFKDPLFYHQPLHFHYNQSIPSIVGSEYERGDRARFMNEIKSNEYRKQKSLTSRKYQIEKSKSNHRRHLNTKKSKNKLEKLNEKKKKNVSKRNINKRKYRTKTINRSTHPQLRYQSKTRHALLLKHRRQQQVLLRKKKELLKKRNASKRSITKIHKNKSITLNKHIRKLNATNNRAPSTMSSRRSFVLPITKTISKTESTESNKIKEQKQVPILDSILSSTNPHIMSGVEQSPFLITKEFSDSSILPRLSLSKSCACAKFTKKLSKKKRSQSKLNVKKVSLRKSKLIKRRNHGKTKLNIRSPIQTTFKKNVRHYQKRKTKGNKTKFPRCTSKTLIRLAPIKRTDENVIKSIKIGNDNNSMKMSSSLFSLKKLLANKQSLTPTIMPLTKNIAHLTSKNNNNNNKHLLQIKRRPNRSISIIARRKSKEQPKREIKLRSRTIIVNNINSTKRKDGK